MLTIHSLPSSSCIQFSPPQSGVSFSFPWTSLNCDLVWSIRCGKSDVVPALGLSFKGLAAFTSLWGSQSPCCKNLGLDHGRVRPCSGRDAIGGVSEASDTRLRTPSPSQPSPMAGGCSQGSSLNLYCIKHNCLADTCLNSWTPESWEIMNHCRFKLPNLGWFVTQQ